MEPSAGLVVLVTDHPGEADRLRAALAAAAYRVLTLGDLQTAEARVAGGGVDLVVTGPSQLFPKALAFWNRIAALSTRAPKLPILVLRDAASQEPAGLNGAPIAPNVSFASESEVVEAANRIKNGGRKPAAQPQSATPGRILCVQGAKGGVGATTVALNLAVLLAHHGKTILVEMRPAPGTLASQFQIRRNLRTIADLAASNDATRPADVKDCLWPCPDVGGLSILFGPRAPVVHADWAARGGEILQAAAELAEYVVVDLPGYFFNVQRAVLGRTDCFLFVMERDALSLEAGKVLLDGLEAANLLPQSTVSVVVARAPLAVPLELSEISRELRMPVAGYIPPAPDLCIHAYKARTSIVVLDPESMLAASFANLAESLPAAFRPTRKMAVF